MFYITKQEFLEFWNFGYVRCKDFKLLSVYDNWFTIGSQNFFLLDKPNGLVWQRHRQRTLHKYSNTAIDESIDCEPRIPTGGRDDNLTRSERSLKFAKYGLVSKNKIRKIFKNLPNIDSFQKIHMDKFSKKIYGQIFKKNILTNKAGSSLAGWLASWLLIGWCLKVVGSSLTFLGRQWILAS